MQFNQGFVQATAQTETESLALINLALSLANEEPATKTIRPYVKRATVKKAYKKQYMRDCLIDGCTQRVKGNVGLGIHLARSHKTGNEGTVMPGTTFMSELSIVR